MRFPGTPAVRRLAAMLGVCIASGLSITFLLLPEPPASPAAKPPPVLRVAGVLVPTKGDVVASALDLVRRYASGEVAIRLPDGATRKIRRGALGAEIDRVRLAELVKESQRPGSAARREFEASDAGRAGQPLDMPLPVSLDPAAAIDALLALKGELDSPASDAYVDLEKRKLEPEKTGHRLDVYGTIARLEAAFRDGKDVVDAAVEEVAPKLYAKNLGNVKFDHVLGYFETRYSTAAKSKERTYNLRLAASKLDGAVILPGETFDFNGTVGPRDEAHGYRVAPVIAQGEVVDGLGGGTCQISGTLHGAAFFAGLEVVERYPHSRPSSYIKLGLDATVVYPTIDFRIKNTFDHPVVLHETVSNGVVRAEILGPERTRTVTFFRRIDEVVPFEELERETPKLPEGTRVLAQRGIPGFRTTSSRVVRIGAYASRTKWSDTYPPTTQIVNVGTGPKDTPVTMKDDAHPEYVVDRYLVVTQGPDIHTPGVTGPEPGGGTIENREPGDTGTYGWTEKAGLSKFHDKSGGRGADGDAPPAEGEGAVRSASVRDGDAPSDVQAKVDKDERPKKKRKHKKKHRDAK
jgi:vancomycin resistance protein YoaR